MEAITIPNHILIPEIKKLIDKGHTTTFRVRGNSMRIFLEDRRDKVILGPCTEEVKCGDVILAEVKPQVYVLHRVIRIDGDAITLQGDGNAHGKEYCKRKDIIGIALGFYRKGRTQPDMVTDRKWRIYSRIWVALCPIRIWLLRLWHIPTGIRRRLGINK